jgi:hypothetical protein
LRDYQMAGECAERQLAGEVLPKFNWLDDNEDAEHARHFAAQMDVGDEFQNRDWATHRTRTLVRNWWPEIEAVAERLQRHKTIVGEEVAKTCLAEAARRSARLQAASPPKPPRPDRVPKRPRAVAQSGTKEVRPFRFKIEKEAK